MKRQLLFLSVFAVLHTVATVFLGLTAMGAAMSGFEPGTQPVSPETWRVISALTDLAILPFGPLVGPRGAPGLWGYAVVLANGFAWGVLVLACWHALRYLRRRHARAA
jgi:hypothetical protein